MYMSGMSGFPNVGNRPENQWLSEAEGGSPPIFAPAAAAAGTAPTVLASAGRALEVTC